MAIKARLKLRLALLPLLLCVSACSVGPDYTPPDVETPESYLRDPHNQASQIVESPGTVADWWSMLHDPILNDLVSRVAGENLDILAADTRLAQSRAERGITAADIFPQINGDASYTREKLSDKGVISLISGGGASSGAGGGAGGGGGAGIPTPSSSPPFNVYQYGFDLSWEIDLWGRVRRGIEAANATVQATQEDRRGILISSIAELVRDYVQLRGTQESLIILHKDLRAGEEVSNLVKERVRAGLNPDQDLANARAETSSIEAQIPPLEQQQSRLMNAIALLLGQPPGALERQLLKKQPMPLTPPQVPIGVPSELVQRRPDIRQAEDQLHAATANVGVAEADFFPRVTLMGSGMLQALEFADLNSWAARSYSFGPSITLPIFEGGRLTSSLDLRNEQEKEAAIQFRKTVLTAFHDVDNALTAFRSEQQRHVALVTTLKNDHEALELAVDRYKNGLSDFLTVLTDEQNTLNAETQAVQSRQAVNVAMVQLYKALGGGWEKTYPDKKYR